MATMQVKNATGGTETVEKPLAPGRVAATGSRPVALSEEDFAALQAIAAAIGGIGGDATAANQVTEINSLAAIAALITTTNAKDFATQTTLAAVLAKIIAAPATEAKQDTANTVLGSTSGPAVVTDANGTLQQYLRGLITQWTAATLRLASTGFSSTVTLTRPNDTAGYSLNDVLGAATGSTAALTFSSVGPAAGGQVQITSVSLQIDSTALISGESSYRLYLYSITPPSAIGDNGAFALSSAGDRDAFLGFIDLGFPAAISGTLFVQSDLLNKQVKLAGPNLFGYLVTNGIYTPTASRVYRITLYTIAV